MKKWIFLFCIALVVCSEVSAQDEASDPVLTPPAAKALEQDEDEGIAEDMEPVSGLDSEPEQAPENVDPFVVSADSETLKNLPSWNCRVDGTPQAEGAFTVGETFLLVCQGSTVDIGSGSVHFQMPEPLLYAIKVLSVDQLKPNEVIFTATSYFPGQHNLDGLVVVEDLVEKFTVKPLTLNVRSVIKDPKQKPYGLIGAMKMAYPQWLWIGLFVFLVGGLGYGLFRFHRRAQKLRVMEALKMHTTALGPYNQFNKDLRALNRTFVFSKHKKWAAEHTHSYLEQLDEFFRLFVLREFVVPATTWKTSLVLKEIRKKDKNGFRSYGKSLTRALRELDRAKSSVEKLKMEDCQQLTQVTRRVSQSVWQVRKVSFPTRSTR